MRNKNYFIGFVALIIFLLICYHFWTAVNFDNIKYVKIAGQEIKVELVLTKEAQKRGLSGRNELKKGEGMLFVFEQPARHYFWMKEMNFPIDIIWLSEGLKVIYVKKDARPASPKLQRGEPESYLSAGEVGLETYGPDAEVKYVLEVAAGFSEENNLQIGDKVQFIYQ